MKNNRKIWGWILIALSVITLMVFIFVDIPGMSEESALKILISISVTLIVGVFLLGAGSSKINYNSGSLKNKVVFEILYVALDFENTFPHEGSGNMVIEIKDSSPIVVNFDTSKKCWEGDTPGKGQKWKKYGEKFILVK